MVYPALQVQSLNLPGIMQAAQNYRMGEAKLGQFQQQSRMQQMGQQYASAALAGDPEALRKGAEFDPERFKQYQDFLGKASDQERAQAKEQAVTSARLALGVLQAPPPMQPEAYHRALAQASEAGLDISQLPPDFSPDVLPVLEDFVTKGLDLGEAIDFYEKEGAQKPFTLGPGQTRYGAGGDIITQAPAAEARPSSLRYQNLGPYVDEQGQFIGEGLFNPQTGDISMRQDGKDVPLPAGAKPRTESALDKGVMVGQQFYKLASEAEGYERSLRELTRYMKNVESTDQGWGLLVDQLHAHLSTIFNGELTATEFRTLLQSGELQGLLGGFRKEVVGGGVMTEQDALRVIARLGGNVGLLRNKEVAIQLLKELFMEKATHYNNVVLPMYNAQVKAIPRGDYATKESLAIAPELFSKTPIPPPPPGFVLD